MVLLIWRNNFEDLSQHINGLQPRLDLIYFREPIPIILGAFYNLFPLWIDLLVLIIKEFIIILFFFLWFLTISIISRWSSLSYLSSWPSFLYFLSLRLSLLSILSKLPRLSNLIYPLPLSFFTHLPLYLLIDSTKIISFIYSFNLICIWNYCASCWLNLLL